MLHVLIVYGTTDGHTAKVAGAVEHYLGSAGHEVRGWDADGIPPQVRPEEFDTVLVLASIHLGGYQKPVRRWVKTQADALNRLPTGFLSVCVAVLQQDPKVCRHLETTMDRFCLRTGWRPGFRKAIPGALPYTKYGLITRWVMKGIAAKVGRDTDTSRDYEYTDWDDLRKTVLDFAARLAPAPTPAPAPASTA